MPDNTSAANPLPRLEGELHLPGSRVVPVNHTIRPHTFVLGRSDPAVLDTNPFKPVKRDGVNLGLGVSPKLSRAHFKIQFHPSSHHYMLVCLGRNGVTVSSTPQVSTPDLKLTPNSSPFQLFPNARISVAGASLTFVLPSQERPSIPSPRRNSLQLQQTHNSSHNSRRKNDRRQNKHSDRDLLRQPHRQQDYDQHRPMDHSHHPSQHHHEHDHDHDQNRHHEDHHHRPDDHSDQQDDPDDEPDDDQDDPMTEDRKNSLSTAATRKRQRRDWIKTEHTLLRTHMMRFGYGRWDSIIASASGRLSERHPHELIPVARKFIARCYVHARPGVERKSLWDILRRHPKQTLHLDDKAADDDIKALIKAAEEDSDPSEQRKYVRWARKLRLLSRLNDIHDHPSLDRLRAGALKVYTPPPTLYWTSGDDADLILGSYKHGYGACELMRNDPELGFLGRYSSAAPSRKPGTPSKPDKHANSEHNASDDDEDDDDDEDEDDRHPSPPHDDDEEETPGAAPSSNPRKRLKLGDGSAKKDESSRDAVATNGLRHDLDLSPDHHTASDAHMPDAVDKSLDKPKDDPADGEKKKKFRIIPRRGPRIGNDDGFNDPEAAKEAHLAMADENGLVPFPNSEYLMRRLKSIINSCAKEYDRDQREIRKKEEAASRAKRRKDDLAERKAIKEAEKTRQRAERRIAKSQPFSKKEATEFERALTHFGVTFLPDGKTVDWKWFHKKVEGFEAKYDETMWSAYLELLAEAHRLRDLNAARDDEDYETVDQINESRKPSTIFTTLTFERAERLLERIQFFRSLRSDLLVHPKLESVLRGIKRTKDLPPWWKSTHDRSLLYGVDKHGMAGFDQMGKDPEFAFAPSIRSWQRKNGNDSKLSKWAVMPKTTVLTRRANALMRYFVSHANDPHLEMYAHPGDGHSIAASGESDKRGTATIANGVEVEAKEEAIDVEMKPVKTSNGRTEGTSSLVSKGGNPKHSTRVKVENGIISDGMTGGTLHVPRGNNPSVVAGASRQRNLRQTVIDIARDENGYLILPVDLGEGLVLLSLGEVYQGNGGFCANGLLFPVGFRSIRIMGYLAFLCEIGTSADDMHPDFQVSILEGLTEGSKGEEYMWTNQKVVANGQNINKVWMRVMNEFVPDGDDGKVGLACGAERFGLYEPTIVYHIQKLGGAQHVEGFELRDFSKKGGGAKVERSVGILEAMMKALEHLLERGPDGRGLDGAGSDDEDSGKAGFVLIEEREMCIPDEWIVEYRNGSKKKRRRASNLN